VKRQIAERGVLATLGAAPRPARSALRALGIDVVDRAFAKAPKDGLRRLVAGTCVSNVWAPTVTITMTADGHVGSRLSGGASALRVD
jgi:succinylarginine dihydrolase